MRLTKIENRTKQTAANIMDDGRPARRFKWVVEFEVDEVWVADGFEITNDVAAEMIEKRLGYANDSEISARVIAAPDATAIREAQGYEVGRG